MAEIKMQQSSGFVPIRLLVALMLILAASLSQALAATETILLASNEKLIDPITTGASVPSGDKQAHNLKQWEAAKKRFEECGLCGEGQAFPGELPQ